MPSYGFTFTVWIGSQHQSCDAIMLELLLDSVQPHLSTLINAPGHFEVVINVHGAGFGSKIPDMALAFQDLYRNACAYTLGNLLGSNMKV